MRNAKNLARRVAVRLERCKYDVCTTESIRLEVDVAPHRLAGLRIEIRHPHTVRDGRKALVGLISMSGDVPEVVYAAPTYRAAIERVLAREWIAVRRMDEEERGMA